MNRRIAIVASHPVQYHAHWYRALAGTPGLDVEVLYCHRATPHNQAQAGFGVDFSWDVPLLEGYRYRFLRNVSRKPGVTEFAGTDAPDLRDILVRERYDAVVVSGWHTRSYWQAIRACWQCGTPVMVRSDSHLHDARPALRQALKWLPYRYFISRFDACLAAGTWSKDYFLHYGARPERVIIVPHCVPQRVTSADQVEALCQEWRTRWGLPNDDSVFLYAGKFIARKRPFDFIKAIASAAASGAPVHGLLVGDGPLRNEMESMAGALRAPVTLTGFLNQSAIHAAYAASDVLALPSDQDTWGLVVNEAMTYGRPCIVSDRVGCGPDLIVHGQTGFIAPLGDVETLAGYMKQFANTPGMAARMGAEAERFIARHSVQAAVDGLLQAIAAIIGNG
jgi:glycosyltransferase involved in cell wall biosynthesis